MTDENWLQLITFIQENNVPVEHACEVFRVTRKDIHEQMKFYCELDPCVTLKSHAGVLSLGETEVTWVTVVELRLLGVKLLSRDVKNVGRVQLPCTPVLKLDAGEIVADSAKEYLMYPVPDSVLKELWQLRPDREERKVFDGDARFVELLLKRLAYFQSRQLSHWSEVDVARYKSDLVSDRLFNVDKPVLRKAVLVYENKKILEWSNENGRTEEDAEEIDDNT